MARGVNKVILVGNLGADPETRSMPSGMTVTNIRIATSESWKDKASGAQQERTEWHSIALFGRLGEIAAEYLRKGSQVFVEGKLRTRKWQDKQGNDRFTTEIIADNMQMLGGRGRRCAAAQAAAERGAAARALPPRDDYDQSPAPAGRQRGIRRRHSVLSLRANWAQEQCGYRRLMRVAQNHTVLLGQGNLPRFGRRRMRQRGTARRSRLRCQMRSTAPPPAAR